MKDLLTTIRQTAQALEEVTDCMHYENDDAVTFLDGHQIQRCYDALTNELITLRALLQTARLRTALHTGTDMLDTLTLALEALNTAPRFPVRPGLTSYDIAGRCERALRGAGVDPYRARGGGTHG
jgi:hypothetical protein